MVTFSNLFFFYSKYIVVLDVAENPLGGGITENIGNLATVCKSWCFTTAYKFVWFSKLTSLIYKHTPIF
jgi:hypothetical protein